MSAYAKAVEADSPLNYWKLAENSGAAAAGGKAITLNGTAPEATGPLEKGDEGATSFDGSNDFGSVALNLSAEEVITVEFWVKWDNFANDDDLLMEFTPNFNSNIGGFLIDPNDGGSPNQMAIGIGDSGERRNNASFTRYTAGTWHHWAVIFDTRAGTPSTERCTLFLDGVEATRIVGASGNNQGKFSNSTLYLASRAGAALFGGMDLAHLAIYSGVLKAERIAAHYAARKEEEAGGGKTINLEFSESIGINETHADTDSKVLKDAIALGESHQTSTRKAIEDKVALTDTLARTLGISRKEAVAISDTLTVATQHVMHQDDTIALNDALTRAWTALRTLTDSFTVTDSMKTSTAKLLEDSIVLAELHRFTLSMNFSEGISITDTLEIGKVLAVSINDSFSLVEDLRRDWRARRTFEEVVAIADEMGHVWTVRPTFEEAVVVADSIEVKVSQPLVPGTGETAEEPYGSASGGASRGGASRREDPGGTARLG